MSQIVVGVDGSPHSRLALDWALDEAGLRQVPLSVVAVLPVAMSTVGFSAQLDPLDPLDETGQEVVQQATQDLVTKAVADRAGQPPVSVTVRTVIGLPADELIRLSEDADLLVVGARGAGGFGRLMMGSVSTQVTHHARCPVAVVPGEQAR